MSKLDSKIGFRVRELRESLKYSREGFSEESGISSDFLYDIETSRKDFSTETLKKLCSLFKVSSDYLLYGTENISDQIKFLLKQMDEEQLSLTIKILKAIISQN